MLITKIIVGLLSAFFLFASSIKVFAWQKMIFDTQVEMMKKYGLNRQILFLIGIVEMFAAVAIWFQGSLLGAIGAGAILPTSLGAIFFHLVYDTWKEAVPAMITAPLSAFVLWQNREPVFGLLSSIGIL